MMVRAFDQAYCRQRPHGAFVPFRRLERLVRIEQRQFDVVYGRGPRQKIEALEYKADLVIPHLGQLVFLEFGHVLAVEHVLSARGPIEAAENVHERRLARARGACCRDKLARLDVQAHAAERVHFHLAHVVRLDEILDGDDRHERPPLPPPPPRGPPPPPPNPPPPKPPRWLPKIGAAVPAALVALRCAAVITFVTTS